MHVGLVAPPTRSLLRDTVRLIGLRRRADLNDCYGLVQARVNDARHPALYAVYVAGVSIIVKWDNLVFVGAVRVYPLLRTSIIDARKLGLVLGRKIRAQYAEVGGTVI